MAHQPITRPHDHFSLPSDIRYGSLLLLSLALLVIPALLPSSSLSLHLNTSFPSLPSILQGAQTTSLVGTAEDLEFSLYIL